MGSTDEKVVVGERAIFPRDAIAPMDVFSLEDAC
jgi:hypothetical protein